MADQASATDQHGGRRGSQANARGRGFRGGSSRGGGNSNRGGGFGGPINGGNGSGGGDRDWDCGSCNSSNFARRDECYRCHAPRTGSFGKGQGGGAFGSSGGGGGGGGSRRGGHGGGGNDGRRGGNSRPVIQTQSTTTHAHNDMDLTRFVKKLGETDAKDLASTINRFAAIWKEVWRSPKRVNWSSLRILLTALARIPASSNIDPPPITEVVATFDVFFDQNNRSTSPEEIVKDVDLSLDVVNRLVKFLWQSDKNGVQDGLQSILCTASSCLTIKYPEHRKSSGKINDLIELLEKPWTVKVAEVPQSFGTSQLAIEPQSHFAWRQATVGWLGNASLFNPFELPKMHTPRGRGNGVYSSPQEYFDVVFPLMVAMTFEEGNSSLSPMCHAMANGKACGKILRPIESFQPASGVQCMVNGCNYRVVLSCSDNRHNRGLCSAHAEQARALLLSGPGNQASTHIYDGFITKITFDGRMYMKEIASRRPPQKEIHWRTSKRLQAPNLVGLVRLSTKGAKLHNEQSIVWAEIVEHSRDSREDEYRKAGMLALSILQLGDVFSSTVELREFHAGEYVAVIDCQTFVPEYIPVLKALEVQRETTPLPFNNGALLNISLNRGQVGANVHSLAIEDESDETDDAISFGRDIVVSDETRQAVKTLVSESLLEPIIQIRRNNTSRRQLEKMLMQLVEAVTLDEGQFDSFIGALLNPVHCTQGPPGTGKSYLGVVIARALLIVRDLWIKTCPSISAPPLLVLSYKNHAIDEFLCDLVAVEPNVSLIRIGSIKDERLRAYSESSFAQSNHDVKNAKLALERLHNIKLELDQFYQSKISFGCAKDSIFLPPSTDADAEKTRRTASYDATTQLAEALAWLGHFSSALPTVSQSPISLKPDEVRSGNADGWSFDCGKLLPLLHDAKNRRVLSISFVQKLYDGIKHYNPQMDAAEVLWNFIIGFKPLPQCAHQSTCPEISEPGSKFCADHQCISLNGNQRCQHSVLPNKTFCIEHACLEEECPFDRISEPSNVRQVYCEGHACYVCVSMGFKAELGNDLPPRNTCDRHPLCAAISKNSDDLCNSLTEPDSPFCSEHALRYCTGRSKKGKPCRQSAISCEVPFCTNHLPQDETFRKATSNTSQVVSDRPNCQSLTSRGNPCRGFARPGILYCPDHFKNPKLPSSAPDQKWTIYEPVFAALPNESDDAALPDSPFSAVEIAETADDNDGASEFVLAEEVLPLDLEQYEVLDDARHLPDNPDETEDVADHIQHLREIYADDAGDYAFEDETPRVPTTSTEEESLQQRPQESELTYISSNLWSWDMSLQERWNACQSAIDLIGVMTTGLNKMFMNEVEKKRKEYHHADIRARSKVYEGKSVIGGTIVGCISRLDAIRVTNPFAVVVEEASEVLEPLLFSCLGVSTCKLEMIGDHYQLQPSMMQKFEFERVNKMNMSLFERLILAPSNCRVPQSVLSIQRRMRPNIADLTRDFYSPITAILDHSKCVTRRIGDDFVAGRGQTKAIAATESRGWYVPGISSNIYFWTHNGKEERASVGLSKVNRVEAKMVCDLAKYLVTCGVPVTSIAIITPYKGQLMEIRKMLEKAPYNLTAFKDPKNSVVISTVDRFQGDESDIIIASLVIDSKSTSPFVKLLNRMIVLNSRARIGFYIIGNPAYFEHNPVTHWKTTIDRLIEPAPLKMPEPDANDGEVGTSVFSGPRFGSELTLCCPQHRIQTKTATTSTQLKLGFCKVICTEKLPCSHDCGMKCHFPVSTHQNQCGVLIPSPCLQHPQNIECFNLFRLAGVSHQSGVDKALERFKCDVNVQLQLPCTHITNLPCSTKKTVSSGAAPFPTCTKASLTPFIHSECKHELNGKCNVITGYTKNPETVPNCDEEVEYMPHCGHSIVVKCYLKRMYESGASAFLLPCQQSLDLQLWTGGSVTVTGQVLEGGIYGPKDANCQQKVEYLMSCGHSVQVPCERAFALAPTTSVCGIQETDVSPFCGHPFKTTCSEKRALTLCTVGLPKQTPVSVIREGDLTAFGTVRLNHKCKEKIKLLRKCGHEEVIDCCLAGSDVSPCKVPVSINSPLCGHLIYAPCGEQHLGGDIWSTGFKQSDVFASLMSSVMLDSTETPSLKSLPPVVRSALLACKHEVQIVRVTSCGHQLSSICKDAFKLLLSSPSQFKNLKPCMVDTVVSLECGHSQTVKCMHSSNLKNCTQFVERNCWNHEHCRKTVQIACNSSEVPRCEETLPWICPEGHSLDFPICFSGIPSDCPSCNGLLLEEAILDADTFTLTPVLDQFVADNFSQVSANSYTTENESKMFSARKSLLLNSFKSWTDELPLWERPLLSLQTVNGFLLLNHNKKPSQSFNVGTFTTLQNLYGVLVRPWTPGNIQKVVETLKGDQLCTLLVMTGVTVNVLNHPKDMPSVSKNNGQDFKAWHFKQTVQKHYDALKISLNGWENILFWTPFCVRSSGYLTLSKSELQTVLQNRRFPVYLADNFVSKTIRFEIPSLTGSTLPTQNTVDLAAPSIRATALEGTVAEGCSIFLSWDGTTVGLTGTLMKSVERELCLKLNFILKARSQPMNSPFSGVKYLATLRDTVQCAELKLVLALELFEVGFPGSEKELETYIDGVRQGGNDAHPLLVLAVSRIATKKRAIRLTLLRAFMDSSENAGTWITTEEKNLLSEPPKAGKVLAVPTTPKEMWESLKMKYSCSSKAMEDLIELVGLKKVKIQAVELFKTVIGLQKMSPEVRDANMMSLNYSFYGNPGTGKTTVAKMFAQILKDSNMRPSRTFVHKSARELKDEGADKFMETVNKAKDGVLFIDEAYTLNPIDDPKGREIVNELLVVAEDMRDKISIILAGYEDDLQNKLFAFNEGLKSRFQEIVFEDFDEPDLLKIWEKVVKDCGWTADPRIGPLVAKKLAKSANKKGFGNARTVRNKFEEYSKRALSRDSWNGDMVLLIEDVMGENPVHNPKLKRVLEEFEERIGWDHVKKSVKELVSVCEKNYERELQGIDSSPVVLNRLFLGNPGTGKTTCANFYGRLLKNLNFLSKGDVVSATASDFVGAYVGESQKKTNLMLEKARGCVLLIDEAYNLDDSLYGKQVLDALVEKVQGSENDDIAVLLCGYDEPMLAMLRNQNPGLSRRFPRDYAFEFADYNDNELLALFHFECRKKNVTLASPSYEVAEKAIEVLSKQRTLPNFGNAGAVDLLIRNAITKASARNVGGSCELQLTVQDFVTGSGSSSTADGKQKADPLNLLNTLYRIDSVRDRLIELQNAYIVALREGAELPNVTNFVFTGSPGTGKTTVARVMAQILFEMGILSTNRLVETSGLGLTGQYIGQTKKVVEGKLGEARGGVLFIDEAYELGKGHFSDEALTSLVAAMTNPQYKGIVIILAGYSREINEMMDKNVGLKSRFTNYFEFQDWKPEDCFQFFSDRAEANNYVLDEEVEELLLDRMETLIGLPGWGNGRDVTKLWEAVLVKRSNRVVKAPEQVQKTIAFSDVQTALDEMIAPRKIAERVSSKKSGRDGGEFSAPFFSYMQPPPQAAPMESFDFKQEEVYNHGTKISEIDEVDAEEESDEEEEVELTIDEILNTDFGNGGRDPGVTDEQWVELELSKQKRREELERQKRELEELKRLSDERERQRLIQEVEKKIREKSKKEQEMQERIRRICLCPAGYQWAKVHGGWRCGGGAHLVTDAQLESHFTV
ncbi:UNVERIFIED_CONTAM: hypothetical protein HDU68_012270 [Siphonaria sp. JEL0065]|nr:hypothetical protein HDU68_012270 [Siphonaria sp. JEL0065]